MSQPKNPHAIFEIDGFQWDSFRHKSLFKRVSVELATGEASQAVWECFDDRFAIINQYAGVADGKSSLPVIRAWLGYGDDLGEPIFKGLLARVGRSDAGATTFRAYDMSYKMKLIEKSDTSHKGEDLEIIKTLVTRNGLQCQGPAKPLKLEAHKAIMQDFQTDWHFAAEIAHDAGLLLWTRGDTVFADYPAKVGEPAVTLTYKKDFNILRNFNLEFKVPEAKSGRPKGVEVRGRARGGKRLKGSSEEGQRGREILHAKKDLSIHSQQRATARAQAQRELDREHAFELTIAMLYSPTPAVRSDVRLTTRLLEIGKLFSGDYLNDKVTHEFARGRLSTMFDLYRDVKE